MRDRGRYWGEYLNPDNTVTDKQKIVHEFYDSAHTFYSIADYLGEEEPWHTYARWAISVYRDGYLIPNDYRTAAWRRSSLGMYEHFLRGGDTTLEELEALRDQPAYSWVRHGRGQGGAEHRSRAIAFAVQSHVVAERAGSDRRYDGNVPTLSVFIPWMASHLYEWRTGNYKGTPNKGEPRFAPFMFGLTAHALIDFYEWELERGADPDAYWPKSLPIDYGQGDAQGEISVSWPGIEEALADVARWAVLEARHDDGSSMWRESGNGDAAFLYESINEPGVAYDLSMLIAPVYAWLWKITGNPEFRLVGDKLFLGGARKGATLTGKHFNQQFRIAFDFLQWRREGDLLACAEQARTIDNNVNKP